MITMQPHTLPPQTTKNLCNHCAESRVIYVYTVVSNLYSDQKPQQLKVTVIKMHSRAVLYKWCLIASALAPPSVCMGSMEDMYTDIICKHVARHVSGFLTVHHPTKTAWTTLALAGASFGGCDFGSHGGCREWQCTLLQCAKVQALTTLYRSMQIPNWFLKNHALIVCHMYVFLVMHLSRNWLVWPQLLTVILPVSYSYAYFPSHS